MSSVSEQAIASKSVAEPTNPSPSTESDTSEEVRKAMTQYWEIHTGDGDLENMMLDSRAAALDKSERPEILQYLPELKTRSVAELGAGSGRFTTTLAEKCKRVVAVDFIGTSIEVNRRNNAAFDNVDFLVADVTQLEFPQGEEFDIVFSNWLLMYLSDEEVTKFAQDCLKWIKPGGNLFFRESCFHSSGDASREENPTQYRDPEWYTKTFSQAILELNDESGKPQKYGLELEREGKVQSYVELKQNENQRWWLWRKVPIKENSTN